jgi:hypothetical protein
MITWTFYYSTTLLCLNIVNHIKMVKLSKKKKMQMQQLTGLKFISENFNRAYVQLNIAYTWA